MIAHLCFEQGKSLFAYSKIRARIYHTYVQRLNRKWKLIEWPQTMEEPVDYSKWSPEQLIDRVTLLERKLREQTTRKTEKIRINRKYDPSRYSTRLIALKFAYLGRRYNGLEYTRNNPTPLPTIEEVLWHALKKTHLISPTPDPLALDGEISWHGCDYSKCGRTDKGVSSFGQVIGVRVRSNRPSNLRKGPSTSAAAVDGVGEDNPFSLEELSPPPSNKIESDTSPATTLASPSDDSSSSHPIDDEIPYIQILNRVLPSDIRVLAWCPTPPANFSARFSCEERRYKYFFTQPAFTPTPGHAGVRPNRADPTPLKGRREGWLDIQAMKVAAKKFEGLHDFRNFCKVDPSRQTTNFKRRILHADIEEVDVGMKYLGLSEFQRYEDSAINHESSSNIHTEAFPKVYTVTLHGTAFLWHQIRHMVAILFLIGQGLESPDIIDELLNVQKHPQKPVYKMADDAPLVLWDCVFPSEESNADDNAVKWLFVGDSADSESTIARAGDRKRDGKHGLGGILDDMWIVWRQRKIDELLAGALLNVIAGQGNQDPSRDQRPQQTSEAAIPPPSRNQKMFTGGNSPRMEGRYIPVLEKPLNDTAEVMNARYAERRGPERKAMMDARCAERRELERKANMNSDQDVRPDKLPGDEFFQI